MNLRPRTLLFWVLVITTTTLVVKATQPTDDVADLRRWLQSDDPTLRLEAVKQLAEVKTSSAGRLLAQALDDSNPSVRALAASALRGYRGSGVVSGLQKALEDEDHRVRASAVWSLCHTGDLSSLERICGLAQNDPASLVRFRATWGLGILGDRRGLSAAVAAITDQSPSVREEAALHAINLLADRSVSGRLLRLAGHPQVATRRMVMYLLGRYPSRKALPALATAMRDADPLVRGEAALTAGRLQARGLFQELTACLGDDDEHVRGSAAYALGLMDLKQGVGALRPLLDDEAAFVRAIAAESLQRLGDKTVSPPEGFRAEELFTFPMFSPAARQLAD